MITMKIQLLERAQIASLSKVNGFKSTVHILLEWFAIFSLAYLSEYFQSIAFSIFVIILISARYHALAVLGHDGNHYLLYSKPWVNRLVVVTLLLWPISAAIEEFKQEHLEHHRFLGTDKDPDFQRLKRYPEFRFPIRWAHFSLILFMDLVGLNFVRYFRRSRQFRVLAREKAHSRKTAKIVFILASYGVILILAYALGYLRIALLYWLIPYMTWNQVIFRIRTIAEHSVVEVGNVFRASTVTSGWITELFFGLKNANYHIEHHLFPSVPWFNLKKLHLLLVDSSPEYRGSASVFDSYFSVLKRCLI